MYIFKVQRSLKLKLFGRKFIERFHPYVLLRLSVIGLFSVLAFLIVVMSLVNSYWNLKRVFGLHRGRERLSAYAQSATMIDGLVGGGMVMVW